MVVMGLSLVLVLGFAYIRAIVAIITRYYK